MEGKQEDDAKSGKASEKAPKHISHGTHSHSPPFSRLEHASAGLTVELERGEEKKESRFAKAVKLGAKIYTVGQEAYEQASAAATTAALATANAVAEQAEKHISEVRLGSYLWPCMQRRTRPICRG